MGAGVEMSRHRNIELGHESHEIAEKQQFRRVKNEFVAFGIVKGQTTFTSPKANLSITTGNPSRSESGECRLTSSLFTVPRPVRESGSDRPSLFQNPSDVSNVCPRTGMRILRGGESFVCNVTPASGDNFP